MGNNMLRYTKGMHTNQNNMPDSLTDFLVGIRKSGGPASLQRLRVSKTNCSEGCGDSSPLHSLDTI